MELSDIGAIIVLGCYLVTGAVAFAGGYLSGKQEMQLEVDALKQKVADLNHIISSLTDRDERGRFVKRGAFND